MIQYSGSVEYTPLELQELITKIKVIIYVRVSTVDQVDNYSIESQIDRCVAHAVNKIDATDEEILVVIEPGLSGDDPDRPGLNHVVWLLEQGVGRKVLFLHPNRLSRNIGIQNNFADRVWRAGADIMFAEMEFDKDNPESVLQFNIHGSFAQYQKAKILADTKRGRLKMVSKGKIPGIRRCYGYTFDKDQDSLIENPEEKKTYLTMVNWFLHGKNGVEMNCTAIAEELALLGVPAPEGEHWYQASVSRILRSETFTGKFYFGKTRMQKVNGKKKQVPVPREEWSCIQIPAYVDEETYKQIQDKLDQNEKRGRGPKNTVLLQGLVRCGRCGYGAGPTQVKQLKSGPKYRYYVCYGKSRKAFKVGTGEVKTQCKGRNWRQDVIDKYVWDFIVKRLRAPETVIAEVVKQQGDIKKLEDMQSKKVQFEKRLKEKQSERKNIMLLFTRGTIKDASELDEMLVPVDEQIEKIEKDLSVCNEYLRLANTTFNELEMIKASIEEFARIVKFDELTFDAKRDLVQRFIEEVVLHDETIEIVTKWRSSPDPSGGGNKKKGLGTLDNTGHLRLVHKQENNSKKVCNFKPSSRLWREITYLSNDVSTLPQPQWGGDDFKPMWNELVPELDKLVMMYWYELLTFEEIAKKVGQDWWVIKELFKQFNVPRMTLAERAQYKRELDVAELDKLVMMYWYDLLSFEEIAKKVGQDPWVIKGLFKQYNIPKMTSVERAQYKRELDYDLFNRLHHKEGKSLGAIHRETGYSRRYIRKVLSELGLSTT